VGAIAAAQEVRAFGNGNDPKASRKAGLIIPVLAGLTFVYIWALLSNLTPLTSTWSADVESWVITVPLLVLIVVAAALLVWVFRRSGVPRPYLRGISLAVLSTLLFVLEFNGALLLVVGVVTSSDSDSIPVGPTIVYTLVSAAILITLVLLINRARFRRRSTHASSDDAIS
jgi:glucan phosphoethanolaminetransferase (alkaline phosphatase superfamily)